MPNYNNYYSNPYQMYNGFNSGYVSQTPQYPQMPQNVVQPTQPTQPTNLLPLTFVSGVEGAKSYIVNPNSTIYLRDSDSNLIFEKSADNQGRYTLIAYKMEKVDLNHANDAESKASVKVDYATKSDLSQVEKDLLEKIDKLSSEIKNLPKTSYRENYKQTRGD